ncbi:MAG: helix-turn-helix domain-containing protein [Pseudomonadota bacterium]
MPRSRKDKTFGPLKRGGGRGKGPHPIDIHVGGQIRARRILLGLSQEQLGRSLMVTFQQVQKYEQGSNRVSASRLYALAHALGVPVSFFYEGLSGEPREHQTLGSKAAVPDLPVDAIERAESLKLIRFFYALPNDHLRHLVIDVLRTIAQSFRPGPKASGQGPGRRI